MTGTRSNPKVWLPVIAGLFVLVGAWQSKMVFPTWKRDYSVGTQNDYTSLSPDQLLASLAGFREMIAGILWVRADAYFDEGKYDAILPMIRLVTMLDPKQIDVYATGMWHVAYNFTDEESRSDRRYIPAALALGKEGAENNSNTYELFFETGWIWYHKIDDDYSKAVYWLEEAGKRKDMQAARRNLLSNAYHREGSIMKAVNLYQELLDEAEKKFEKEQSFANRQNRDTIEGNLDNLLIRMSQRGWFAQKNGTYEQGDYDTKPPFDVKFSGSVTVEEAKVIRVQGNWNVLPVGTRIRCVLRDADFPNAVPAGMLWDKVDRIELDPSKEQTFMMDQLFVKNRRFNRRIDMSRDVTMYPFKAEKYVLEFYYNPRSAPAHIQDKFGFSGEGMTDANNLNTTIREGQRVIFASVELTRDQIMRRGEWAVGRRTPIVSTKGYVAPTAAEITGEVIQVPGLRNEAGKPVVSGSGPVFVPSQRKEQRPDGP